MGSELADYSSEVPKLVSPLLSRRTCCRSIISEAALKRWRGRPITLSMTLVDEFREPARDPGAARRH